MSFLASTARTPLNRRATTALGVLVAAAGVTYSARALEAAIDGAEPGEKSGSPAALSLESPRVVVLKAKHELCLFDSDTLVRVYPIDLGKNTAGAKIRRGDGRTPSGSFRIATKNAESPYRRFLGLDYPGAEAAKRGLRQGLISRGDASAIQRAIASGRCPDWGTGLGGGIGLHGHRRGSDWTAGCIALSDRDIDELFAVLRLGDPVEILP